MENLLSMYGRDVGVSFNPNETLTADEVAKMCDLSPKQYNREVKRMVDTKHDSMSLFGNQFKRRVG
jgi:hypothetical protein